MLQRKYQKEYSEYLFKKNPRNPYIKYSVFTHRLVQKNAYRKKKVDKLIAQQDSLTGLSPYSTWTPKVKIGGKNFILFYLLYLLSLGLMGRGLYLLLYSHVFYK